MALQLQISKFRTVSRAAQTGSLVIEDFAETFAAPVALSVVSRPAKVACPGTIYTNNPSILLEKLSSEKYVFVYSNDDQLDYSQELPDGDYEFG